MKQWIIRRLFLNKSLAKSAFLAGAALWLIILIPVVFITYNLEKKNISRNEIEQHKAIEILLSRAFTSESRFGDYVNARGLVLSMGGALGLMDLGVCQQNLDVIPRALESRCDENIQTSKHDLGNGIQLRFYWKPSVEKLDVLAESVVLAIFVSLLLYILTTYFFYFILGRRVQILSEIILSEDFIKGNSKNEFHSSELRPLVNAIAEYRKKIDILFEKNRKIEGGIVFASIARQVSHDIRSPLSALNLLIGFSSELSEEKRTLVRSAVNRINDIANQLLSQSKSMSRFEMGESEKTLQVDSSAKGSDALGNLEVQLLAPLVDEIVSEKRIQFREFLNVNIEANLAKAYGVFARINIPDFKCIISNLINNSVEALSGVSGEVGITIERIVTDTGEKAVVRVKDNGRGIPTEIISKIGIKGVSHGKDGTHSGSGLGVHHAITSIKKIGGDLIIDSVEHIGTTVSLILPLCEPPEWFVSLLKVNHNSAIMILDDDQAIHNLWDGRFADLDFKSKGVSVDHASAIENVKLKELKAAQIVLIDYEFIGNDRTGLDFIIENKLRENAILVTSRYEEAGIVERCLHEGVKMIPKNMAAFVPIVLSAQG